MITEDQLEQLATRWFQDTGWSYINGTELAPDGESSERGDFRVVVLKERLATAVSLLNPKLPQPAVEEVVHVISTPGETSLARNNRAFHRLLMDGVKVEFTNAEGEKETDHARLIDFQNPKNNDFLVVNQFTVTGTKKPRRPDIVAFVNGLPLGIIELKNPADTNADVWKAYGQLQTYKDEIADLLVFNEALVVSDGMNARVGSLTANPEWFMPWRTIASENDRPQLEFELEKVVRGFFRPDLFLDYIRYFVLFEQDGDALIKKIAGYHQFHGVREAVRVTLIASTTEESNRVKEERATYGKVVEPGSRKAGVFWHTQGSGKSISMCCYAGKLLQQPEMNNPTLVVVTDRNDLDGQLYQQFSAAKDLLKQTPEQAESREQLREMLAARKSGGIIFTTIQKFSLTEDEKEHPLLCDRSNVVVISDEAHRSQYGLKGRLNTKTGEYVFGNAKHMRDALPNASFIGFTGTPIALEDRDTRGVFGDYVSIYDIQDAVDDKATVPIYYESRLAKLDINRGEIDELNQDVEEVIEDEEDVAARENTKSRWTQLAKLVGAEPRIKEVAADLLKHFDTRNGTIEGKAMFVAMSRDICVNLFNEIIALRPEWAGTKLTKDGKEVGWNPEDGAVRVIMTGNATDRAGLQDHVYTKGQKKRLEKRFKDPADPLKIVIVRDMWLTGFDAPPCHTMYVDKPMHGHNLMQAIARVNRVFKDKPGGLVVDYIGIAAELKNALRTYTDAKGKGQPTLKAEEALKVLLEKLDVVRGMMYGFDYSAYETNALKLLPSAANHLLDPDKVPDGKKRFLDVMASVTKAYSLCGTLDQAANLRKEIAFFSAIKAVLLKAGNIDRKRTEEEKNSALKQILDNAVISEGVTDVFKLAGLDKPNIGLLSDEFLDDVRSAPMKNLSIELLERLLKDEIRSNIRTNLVQEKKYSDRLLDTLRRYHNRAIETAQVIEELISMAKDFQDGLRRNEALGLRPDEVAFYDALADRPEVLQQMGDDTLKQLATELTEQLRASTTVDWQVRDSVRARMRLLIRRLLRKHKYPPEGQDDAVTMVLKQAEALADIWSMPHVPSESDLAYQMTK
jgi:type I restriction enzyme R subunit